MKYLGIIIDNKFKFSEHISYAAERISKLIHSLSKSAKLTWGLNHEALQTIYNGAILPLLLYGAPVWAEAMRFEYNRLKYIRIQWLINIKIAKAFRTASNEALCTLTGITPVVIKVEEAAKLYNMTRNRQAYEIDHKAQPKDWLNPAKTVKITEQPEEQDIQIYKDGSKSEHGVGAGIVIFIQNELAHRSQYTLHNSCSNNQAEQLAIVKALETIEKLHIKDSIPRSATVHTDSRITLQSLQIANNPNYLIDEIRKLATTLEKNNWTIKFAWIRAHVGIYGNELADKLGKEASSKNDISFKRITKTEIINQLREQSLAKWQNQCDHTTKGQITKQFFPNIKDRLNKKIKLTPNFAAIVTAHGKSKAYLHRFEIIESPDCPCNGGEQTVEHIIYDCSKLNSERDEIVRNTSNQDKWPVNKSAIVNNDIKQFTQFINSIDFEKL